jgi:transposase-like protein
MQSHLSAAQFHSEEAAYAYVEARLWPNGPICPHCGATKEHVGRLTGKTNRIGLCKCYACRKPFTVKIGTVFESSHVPMRVWLQAIYLFCSSKKGISTRQLQRTFQCGLKTAWFLGHRVREAMTELGISSSSPLGGQNKVVEADETYIGGKARNRKNYVPPKTPVLSLVEREGKVRSFHLNVPNVSAAILKPIIVSQVNKASYLMTDESLVYPGIGEAFAGHGTVNHSAEEYVRAYFWHTNTVENYFSLFKRAIYGC